MTPYYQDELVTVHAGDCLDVLPSLPDCSVDAVVTDPPYGLGSARCTRTGARSQLLLCGDHRDAMVRHLDQCGGCPQMLTVAWEGL